MNLTDLRSRIRRLEVLVSGLSKEVSLWKDSKAPVLYVDRLEYLEGIGQAIDGLETARLAMVKVCRRIEESPGGFLTS